MPQRRLRPGFAYALYAAVLLTILPAFFLAYPIPGFLENGVALVAAVLLVTGLTSFGDAAVLLVARIAGCPRVSASPTVALAFRFGAGCGILALLILLLGSLPGPLVWKLHGLTVVLAGVLVWRLTAWWGGFSPLVRPNGIPQVVSPAEAGVQVVNLLSRKRSTNFSLLEVASLCLLLAGAGAAFLSAFSPITYYDSLVYHLALPNYYLLADGIRPMPYNLYGFFPQNMEMLFLLALGVLPAPETVINLLGWAMSAAVSVVVFDWGRSAWGRPVGFVAAGLWWSAPAVVFLSTGAYVDVPLAFFTLLAVRAVWLSQEGGGGSADAEWCPFTPLVTGQDIASPPAELGERQPMRSIGGEGGTPGVAPSPSPHWIAVAGFFIGIALGVKYTAGIPAVLLLASVAWLGRRQKPFFLAAVFSLCAAAVFAPWLIRNAVLVGNPVFPFLYQLFPSQVGWSADTAAGYFQILTEYGAQSRLFLDVFLAPWNMITTPKIFGGGFDVLGDFGWPVFLLAAPVAYVVARGRLAAFLTLFVAAFFVAWFVSKPVLRFLVPALPLFALLSGVAVRHMAVSACRWGRVSAVLVTVPWLVSNVFLYLWIADVIKPYRVPLGLAERETFLTEQLPYFAAFAAVNDRLTRDDRVLLLGEQRTYHLAVPFVPSTIVAPSLLATACNPGDIDEALAALRAEGITHLLVSMAELDRLGGPAGFGFTPLGVQTLKTLLSEHAAGEHLAPGHVLYKIESR